MQVDLHGLANNIKQAMGSRDTHGWGYTLDELVEQFEQLQQRLAAADAVIDVASKQGTILVDEQDLKSELGLATLDTALHIKAYDLEFRQKADG